MISVEDFVRDTLLQITKAVSSFDDEKSPFGASANPVFSSSETSNMQTDANGRPIIAVNFDIAVVAAESVTTQAGAGVSVASVVKIGGDVGDETSKTKTSRVAFSLPLRLNDTEEHKEARRPHVDTYTPISDTPK